MFMSHHQVNKFFENVAKFMHLGTMVTGESEEIKCGLNSRNTCYHAVQNLLSFCLLSQNIKIKTYIPIILPGVWYGCELWSLPLRDETRSRVFEDRVLRRIFGLQRDEVTGDWRKLHNVFHTSYSSPNFIRVIK
jgi:hypothetical protein